jgi:hypothetical protein
MRGVLRHAYAGDERRSEIVKRVGLREKVRSAGGNVLEYSFGWAPLMADVSSAVQVFAKGPPTGLCKGYHRVTFNPVEKNFDSNPTVITFHKGYFGWALRADVRCVDSDLALLNGLGLVNIASSVWETTPWSFVVDYFVNVQSFLNSFTDRLGLEFENASSTLFMLNTAYVLMEPRDAEIDTPPWGGYGSYKSMFVSVNRQMGISRPTLSWRSPWSLSPQRALTSIALLLQKFKG